MLYLAVLIICFAMLLCTILLFIKACFAVIHRITGYGAAAAPLVIPISEPLIVNAIICLYFINGIAFIVTGIPMVFYWAMMMIFISTACEACLEYLNRNLPPKITALILWAHIPLGFFAMLLRHGYTVLFSILMLCIKILSLTAAKEMKK